MTVGRNTDSDAFNYALCRLLELISTPVGNEALDNKLATVLKLLLDTSFNIAVVNDGHSLVFEFLKLCFTLPAERLIATYPKIREILLNDIDRIHNANLVRYCTMYRLNPNTVTATELARAMTRGIRVSFHETTREKANHFGVAFLHLGEIRKNSNLERVIKKDINKFSAFYSASDLFKHLIAKGRS